MLESVGTHDPVLKALAADDDGFLRVLLQRMPAGAGILERQVLARRCGIGRAMQGDPLCAGLAD